MMEARSVMRNVSRTLWSVISMPSPCCFSRWMMSWISATAIGSMPTNGSSRRRKRGRGQRPRDLDAPPLAARELGPRAIGQRGQVQLLEQPLEAFLPFRAGELHGLEHGQHVVLHRQLAEDARLLGQVADPPARPQVDGQVGQVLVAEPDPALLRLEQPDDEERRRLAGAVGAEQADDLARLDRDPDVVDHAVLAVGPHQALGHQGRATVRPGLEPASPRAAFLEAQPAAGTRCTWARTSRLIVKCSRLGSLSKPMPVTTSPFLSSRTRSSETILRCRLRKRSDSVSIRTPSVVVTTT